MTNKKCPKCGGSFEEGLVIDKVGEVITVPTSQKWGRRIKKVFQVEDSKEVVTLRCQKCGYLESYAF